MRKLRFSALSLGFDPALTQRGRALQRKPKIFLDTSDLTLSGYTVLRARSIQKGFGFPIGLLRVVVDVHVQMKTGFQVEHLQWFLDFYWQRSG